MFIALDGVFENPSWTAPYGFDPEMGETLGGITGSATDWSTRLHRFVYPVAIGAGAHLWADGVDPTRLRLQDHARYDNGVVYLNYGPA